MKIEKIEIIKYIANDGTEFKTERDCLDHERKLWDALPKCKDCNGAGGKEIPDGHDCWGNMESFWMDCKYCLGHKVESKATQERRELYKEISDIESKIYQLRKCR